MRHRRNAIEFFAGIGLMRMGLEHAGWTVDWANDIDAEKHKMYSGHFERNDAHFHLGDVYDIDPNAVPAAALATASFPCNDLSLAGARRGLAGLHSGAFWGFMDVIKGMGSRRPPLILLENVVGFLTSNDGIDFRDACLALGELGYEVDAFIVDASLFVPQSRQRLFLIGKQRKISDQVSETPSFYQSQCRPQALADFILWNPEIPWSIRPLPPIVKANTTLANIVENIAPNSPLWWDRERAEYLFSQMSERHRLIAEKMIHGKQESFGTVFRRVRNGKSMAELRTDGVAGCLRTPRGGSGRQILFCAGNGEFAVRLITPRECARLMGADEFKITVKPNQALFGFGDAVCVPVIKWIADNYLTPVWKELNGKTSREETERFRAEAV